MTEQDVSKKKTVEAIKVGSFERRLSLTKAGILAGTRMAGNFTVGLLEGKEKRAERKKRVLSEQSAYLASELGKLKGSVVKIGQVMALYGEHFLPPEVTQALHTLEDQTVALDWSAIQPVLAEQLGEPKLAELLIAEEPIGCASLGQVHRATIKSTGEEICLKIQYPGVADAIDADIDAVAMLLKLTRAVPMSSEFEDWLEEVRQMMHREVDYRLEAQTTSHFFTLLSGDDRYVVPEVFDAYSSDQVMATRYEPGWVITDQKVASLPQSERNILAESALELFLKELFVWHEIQTDPNFGNYRIRPRETGLTPQIVLYDFGAVQKYPDSFIDPVCHMIQSAYNDDLDALIDGAVALRFMDRTWPRHILEEFGQVCMSVLEPLKKDFTDLPGAALDEGLYAWHASDLPSRVAKRATRSAISRYFKVPPKEFVFLNRKLVGVYTFISVLDARFNGASLLEKFLD